MLIASGARSCEHTPERDLWCSAGADRETGENANLAALRKGKSSVMQTARRPYRAGCIRTS